MILILLFVSSLMIYNKFFFLEPRAKDSWLLGSIVPVTIILIIYLAFVLKIGPEFMRFRQPINIDRIVTIYNVLQILFLSYLVTEVRKKYYFHRHVI